ncbi:YcaO-like family protein [Salinibacterium sp. NG22]|uniref:YcaO-like family protein n=1 Tax=Salinibacterium sp. NG22 TaxID=2792040 RepID=UPI0018CE6515|nr:YcaO-like family protein [Salinibacterium sp. NG22]MBH0110048.1 YcaO-like family protein [Salinibacterium sp. NG22]
MPSTVTTTPRLEIRALPSDRTLITTPRGNSFALDLPADTVVALVEALSSGTVSPKLPADWETNAAALRELLTAEDVFANANGDDSISGNSTTSDAADAAAPSNDLVAFDDSDGATAKPSDLLVMGDRATGSALVRAMDALRGSADADSVPAVRVVPADDWQRVIHRAFRTGELLVHCLRGGDDATLITFDRLCSDARTPWVALELTRETLWLGPFVSPGTGANYEDFAARRLAAAFDPIAHRALRTPAVGGDSGAAPQFLPSVFETAARTLADTAAQRGDVVLEIATTGGATDDAGGATTGTTATAIEHPVLPLPASVISHSLPHSVSDLVDPVTGLVQRTRAVTHHPSIPASLATAQSDVCNMRRVSRWANNTSCQGSAFNDPEQAAASAVGEAVERYCGNLLDTLPVTFGSYRELSTKSAVRMLDPDSLVLYSDEQYDTPGFPFVRMTADLPIHWVPGRSLTTNEDILVPASMVYVNWFTAGYSAAPVTNFCPFAGIAAGPNMEYAVASALEEIIERHVTMVWWLNGHQHDAIVPTPEMDALWADVPDSYGQRPSIVMLDNEFGVPVAAGILHNDVDTLVNVGFACRNTAEAAALKAWTEACTLQEGSRDLLRTDGAHWDAMARGELNSRSFKPWRADRAYLDSYRDDMRDCDDLMVQQQVLLDPRAVDRVAPLVDRPARRPIGDIPGLPDRSVAGYQAAIEAQGHEVIVVDITSADVASTGMAAVRVIVPGTVGNAPAAFPFLGKRRVQDLAVELGWRDTPLAEADLNYFPLPHA